MVLCTTLLEIAQVHGSSISKSHMFVVLFRSGVDVAFIKRFSTVFFIFLILDAIS
jgi:hypothetical protein